MPPHLATQYKQQIYTGANTCARDLEGYTRAFNPWRRKIPPRTFPRQQHIDFSSEPCHSQACQKLEGHWQKVLDTLSSSNKEGSSSEMIPGSLSTSLQEPLVISERVKQKTALAMHTASLGFFTATAHELPQVHTSHHSTIPPSPEPKNLILSPHFPKTKPFNPMILVAEKLSIPPARLCIQHPPPPDPQKPRSFSSSSFVDPPGNRFLRNTCPGPKPPQSK